MSRDHIFQGICVAAALLASTPVNAQDKVVPEAGWRTLIPSGSSETKIERDSDVEAPLLVKNAIGNIDFDDDPSLQPIRIGSVLIEADSPIDHSIFETVIEPYLGIRATNKDLAKLAGEIADLARSKGMLLANTYIPKQLMELGIIRIVLDLGTIDEVRVEGSKSRALRRLLDPLAGKAVVQKELERRLMLANNIPQIALKRTELVTEGSRRILVINVEERKGTSAHLVIDNFGSENVGPIRARLSVEAVALFDDSDSLNATFRTNPANPSELRAGSAAYSIGLDNNGARAEFAAAWSNSKIAPSFGFGQRDAASQYASSTLSAPLQRSRAANLWVDGQLEYLKVEQESFGEVLQSDTVVTMSIGLSSSLKVGNGWLRTGTQLRRGLGLRGTNENNDPVSSRYDADGQFTSARAWTNWSGQLVGNMTMRMAVSGQLASEPLLASEEMGLGGAYSGRAFEFYSRSGDQGILALVELGYELSKPNSWLKRIQPYAFVDGGYVHNLRGGFGGGTLVSTGGGIRANIGSLGLQLETAIPVYSTGSADANRDPTVNFQVGLDF